MNHGNPAKESHGAKAGGKMCLYNGPTRLSSTVAMAWYQEKGNDTCI